MKKLVSFIILLAFLVNSTLPGHAQALLVGAGEGVLSEPGAMVHVSPSFTPALLKGLRIDVKEPFKFNFILDAGDDNVRGVSLKNEAGKLIRYFMASLAVPEKDLWVNLSPYEKDRIVPEALGVTEMGRDLLAQDYLLKQITASLIYPEDATGKDFWAKIYKVAQEKLGTTDMPTDVFNKVWIVPAKAVVYEEGNKAVVVEAKLKVMLESDYTAMQHHVAGSGQAAAPASEISKQVLRDVVIPVLEKEVNEGRNFSSLRQVYYALILAKWYKENLKQSILSRTYADQNKVRGVEIQDKQVKEKIYAKYVEAFKKGAFNYIKEEFDPASQELVARKYFSGGVGLQFTQEVVHDRAFVLNDIDPVYEVQSDLVVPLEGEADATELPVVNMKEWRTWFWPNFRAGQSKIYISKDGKRVLKVFKLKGLREEHMRMMYEIIKSLPQKLKESGYQGPVEIVVPTLVRIEHGGLAFVTEKKDGYLFEKVLRRGKTFRSREDLQQIAEVFFDAVDAVMGEGMADRNGNAPVLSLTDEAHYLNFLWARMADGQEKIWNIDPIDMFAVMHRVDTTQTDLVEGLDYSENEDKTVDQIMAELEQGHSPLWGFVKDDPEAVAVIRTRLERVLKSRFLDEMRHYLKKSDKKKQISLLPGDLEHAPVVLFGSTVWGRSPQDHDVLVVTQGAAHLSLKRDGIDANIVDQQTLIKGLQTGAMGAVVVKQIVDVSGVFLKGQAKDLGLPSLVLRERLVLARQLINAGQKEADFFFLGSQEIGSKERVVHRLIEGYALVYDALIAEGEPELMVGQKPLRLFYREFLKAEQGQDDPGFADITWQDFKQTFDEFAQQVERLDKGEEMASSRLNTQLIIDKINALSQGIIHGKTGEEYSFVAVHHAVIEDGDRIKVFLKNAQGIVSNDYVALFDVYPEKDLLGELKENFKGVIFERDLDDGPLDLRGGGLGKAFHKILSRAIPEGVDIEAYVFDKTTREELTHDFDLQGDRIFIQVDGEQIEVMDDQFDRFGEKDRRSLASYQVMLSDLLANSAMGRIWSEQSGFKDFQLVVKDGQTKRNGLAALKWWIEESRKPEDAPDKVYLHPFFKAKNIPRWGQDNMLRLRELAGHYFKTIFATGGWCISRSQLIEWFSHYINLPEDILAYVVQEAVNQRAIANPSKNFGLNFDEVAVLRNGVDGLVARDIKRILVMTYGGGGLLSAGTASEEGDTEFETTVKAVIIADARYGKKTDVTFVIYEQSLLSLAKYSNQLDHLARVVRQKYPQWKGKVNYEFRYANLFQAIDDDVVAQAVLSASHITFWRHTWVGDAIRKDPNFPEATPDALRKFAAKLEGAIKQGVLIVKESNGKDFLVVQKLIGLDEGEHAGGIDLTAKNMNVQTTGSGTRFEILDGAESMDVNDMGNLRPVINIIVPIRGVSAFLAS